MKTTNEKVVNLVNQLVIAVVQKDKDACRSYLEDLNLFLQENKFLAEF